MMFLRKVILFIVLIIHAAACSTAYDERIIKLIEKKCFTELDTENCIFDLKEFTDFSWDEVYFLEGPLCVEELEYTIKSKYQGEPISDQYVLVLFFRSGKIIFETCYYSKGSGLQLFPYDGDKLHSTLHYISTKSEFQVKKKYKNDGEIFYILSPIWCN